MIIILNNNEGDTPSCVINFSEREKNDEAKGMFSYLQGMASLLMSVLKRSSSQEIADELLNFFLEELMKMCKQGITAHFNDVEEKRLYNTMEDMFDDWVENLRDSSINSEEELITHLNGYEASFDYRIGSENITFFIRCNNPVNQELKISDIPLTLKEEGDEFDAMVMSAFIVATVTFDKVYGEEKNPLRDPVINALTFIQEVKKKL